MKSLVEKLARIQSQLKAPKNQRNSFGNYNYRSCEDILEAVKPLLAKENLIMTISDDMVAVNGMVYVKTIVKVTDGEFSVENTAFARESVTKKGMDDSQITGSTSSYARKYALNGMFLIDDTKDSDATNDHGKEQVSARTNVTQTATGNGNVQVSTSASKEASGDLGKAPKVEAEVIPANKRSFRSNKPTAGSEDSL
jgi:hypothetical protein